MAKKAIATRRPSGIGQLKKARERIVRLQSSTKRAREQAGHFVKKVVRTGEIGGAALGFGVLNSRYGTDGELKVAGVPVSLGVGVIGHAAAIMGIGSGMDDHLTAIADGALANYATTQGIKMGAEMRSKAGVSGRTGQGLTAAQLEALAQ